MLTRAQSFVPTLIQLNNNIDTNYMYISHRPPVITSDPQS